MNEENNNEVPDSPETDETTPESVLPEVESNQDSVEDTAPQDDGLEVLADDAAQAAAMEKAELDNAKAMAETLGITYHPKIGIVKLSEKIKKAMDDLKAAEQAKARQAGQDAKQAKASDAPKSKKQISKERALKLIRVQVTCMDPSKKEYTGDYFTAGNSVVGQVTRMVPFEIPWHVPQIIINMMNEKTYQVFSIKKNKDGPDSSTVRRAKTYSIAILPDLTPEQLNDLAQRQAMAKGTAESA